MSLSLLVAKVTLMCFNLVNCGAYLATPYISRLSPFDPTFALL